MRLATSLLGILAAVFGSEMQSLHWKSIQKNHKAKVKQGSKQSMAQCQVNEGSARCHRYRLSEAKKTDVNHPEAPFKVTFSWK